VSAEPWVDPKIMVWVGSLGGCLVGLWGAAIGAAGDFLVPKGKAKGLVMTALLAGAGLGVLVFLFGLAVMVAGQPYAVWYPGLLLGSLLSGLAIPFVFVMRNRYREAELRKMRADELS
jgi:hypothetical protein